VIERGFNRKEFEGHRKGRKAGGLNINDNHRAKKDTQTEAYTLLSLRKTLCSLRLSTLESNHKVFEGHRKGRKAGVLKYLMTVKFKRTHI